MCLCIIDAIQHAQSVRYPVRNFQRIAVYPFSILWETLTTTSCLHLYVSKWILVAACLPRQSLAEQSEQKLMPRDISVEPRQPDHSKFSCQWFHVLYLPYSTVVIKSHILMYVFDRFLNISTSAETSQSDLYAQMSRDRSLQLSLLAKEIEEGEALKLVAWLIQGILAVASLRAGLRISFWVQV